MLTFTFLGTSSGVPTRHRNVSGLAVQSAAGAGWLLVDVGEGTQQRLLQTRLSLHDLEAICITHVHGDHCYGLPGLLASAGMAGRKRPLTLIAPRPVWDWLAATRACTDLHLPYEVAHVDVAAAPSPVWTASGLRVDAHALRHRVPSYAYRVETVAQRIQLDVNALHAAGLPPGPMWKALQSGEDVSCDGRVLHSAAFTTRTTQRACAVIGGDNAEPALLREACEGAQLLVHEATYTQSILDKVGPGPMHSAAGQVATFAQSAGLPNLVLTHFSARYQAAAGLAELEAEARAQYTTGALWLANDLDVFELDAAGVLSRRTLTQRVAATPFHP
ncbi:MBL fold metallo-hydrolase [Variovorax sp. J22G21]|uniref:ribonuclease Z n=1 Tax=Variovorax fucosicus TaxID=3053517 RepID=UPI00257640E9|nr:MULTISPECIES: MBL fold metallo-hydrolase [unclassified Variovorax]MDM0042650.1 MBL fold metallo-hydrolase [Variovorax sp. J22R193]MDM0061255.1 MBL fold metallo-hydrolase [Variovorax sp. J22G21]